MSSARREAGFSLIEALAALFLFAVAGVGLMQLQTQSLATFASAEQRALAELVANNRLVAVLSERDAFAPGQEQGEERLAGRVWAWRMVVEPTQDPRAVQVLIEVREGAEAAPSAKMAAFAPAAGP